MIVLQTIRPAWRWGDRVPVHWSRAPVQLLMALAASLACAHVRGDELAFQTLYKFQLGPFRPQGGLVQGSNGNFYGTTRLGGENGSGTVYRVAPDGIVTTLVSFDHEPGPLLRGNDGSFYGTTGRPFRSGLHSVFKITESGALTTLITFPVTNTVDHFLFLQSNDGRLYGTTRSDSTNDLDSIFSISQTGELTTLVTFENTEGGDSTRNHLNQLIRGRDGDLYGTMRSDYTDGLGSVFKVSTAGLVTTLASFNGSNGRLPATLLQGNDGNFYGSTIAGGSNDVGTLFRMTPNGDLATLISFDRTYGEYPERFIQGTDGNFYGMAIATGPSRDRRLFFRLTPGGTFTTTVTSLEALDSGYYPVSLTEGSDGNFYGINSLNDSIFRITPDGAATGTVFGAFVEPGDPSGLVQGNDGTLYGTSGRGGKAGAGAVFKLFSDGTIDVLASLDATGISPVFARSPVLGKDGSLYGTTEYGGTNSRGSVFRLSPAGKLSTLASFDLTNSSPEHLLLGNDGNFYCTTYFSGNGEQGNSVFKLTASGELINLLTSKVSPPFYGSIRNLVQANDGSLYGVTTVADGITYSGTIFRLAQDGALTTLISFSGANAASPQSLILGNDGNFYGTTASFGGPDISGTIFKLTPDGTLTTLITFHGRSGPYPRELIQGRDGDFYGTVLNDGTESATVFKLTPAGALSTLATFNRSNGETPGNLIQGMDGRFYGIIPATFSMAGPITGGAIFRLVQPPFVKAIKLSGGDVNLTWNSISGDTYRVEYKSALSATNWSVFDTEVTAGGSTASFADNSVSANQRYYRVRLLP